MARSVRFKSIAEESDAPSFTPAMNPDDQEDQLIALATDLAIKRMRDGTASNQLISEIIKFGTAKERLAREKLARENELLKAKTEAIKQAEQNRELYTKAIRAMMTYSGAAEDEDYDFFDEDY